MANKNEKREGSAAGKYYVDSSCIDCDLCRQTAPENFARNDDKGYAYVSKQPANVAEEAQVTEAMQNCPVEAIGSDGN